MMATVWVDDWQYQCCGTPFAVGDQVSWTLTADSDDFLVRALGDHAPRQEFSLSLRDRIRDADVDLAGVVGESDGLRVFIDDSATGAPTRDAPFATVRLPREDHHIDVPATLEPTHGIVRRIRLVRFGYRSDGSGGLEPRENDASLEDVRAAPRNPRQQVEGRRFSGFLVDLETRGAGPAEAVG